MSDMIAETADRLFADFAPATFAALPESHAVGAVPLLDDLWAAIEEMGFPLALLPEAAGGFGLAPHEALSIIRSAGAHAIPAPLGETMLANLLLAGAGLALADGPATVAAGAVIEETPQGWSVSGQASAVPWGRAARTVVALDRLGRVARLSEGWHCTPGHNLACEPRDDMRFAAQLGPDCVAAAPIPEGGIEALGALLRAQALAGALEAVLAQCIAYTKERVQFGRSLSAFQVIQQGLAEMAGQVAAARAGADMAAAALPLACRDPAGARRLAGAAKLRAGEAAGKVALVAHQVHGAIGFTREFHLHALTTRLWAWREEDGSESHWAEVIGAECLAGGADAFWPRLTASGGHQP